MKITDENEKGGEKKNVLELNFYMVYRMFGVGYRAPNEQVNFAFAVM